MKNDCNFTKFVDKHKYILYNFVCEDDDEIKYASYAADSYDDIKVGDVIELETSSVDDRENRTLSKYYIKNITKEIKFFHVGGVNGYMEKHFIYEVECNRLKS